MNNAGGSEGKRNGINKILSVGQNARRNKTSFFKMKIRSERERKDGSIQKEEIFE